MVLRLLIFVPAFCGALLGSFFGWKAHARTANRAGHQRASLWFLERADDYTPEGWRYRNLALAIGFAGILLTLFLMLLTSGS
jgi:hypothetical protein